MPRYRGLARIATLLGMAFLALAGMPAIATAEEGDSEVVAYLDGKPISAEEIGRYYCDDFDYPVIQCSKSPLLPSARGTLVALLSGADYVTIYAGTYYSGAYMNVSQSYSSLLTIGWNDRVSSFKGRNSETGRFTTDWFYGGSSWPFCCNSNVSTLGTWNNTFSAVERT